MRTKQGLVAARASKKILGRPKGRTSHNKFEKHHDVIKEVSFTAISKIIVAGSYMGVRNYIYENKEISQTIKQNKESLLAHVS